MAAISVFLLFVSSFLAFVASKWKIKLLSMGLSYLFVFILVAQSWPLALAAIKAISGWTACAILAFTKQSLPGQEKILGPRSIGISFKILSVLLITVIVLAIAPQLSDWIFTISIDQSIGALLLIGIGLMGISLNSRILPIIIGLLSIFAGFEIIYAAVELSSLLAALLAVINLGIAMVGAYLILLPNLEKST